MPDLRTLETFRAFVDTGSVSRAAQRVCRTQPQVGRTLTALQRAIRFGDGETLFKTFADARAVRRSIIEAGQDTAAPNFGRTPKSS